MIAASMMIAALCVAMMMFCISLSAPGQAGLLMEGADRGSGTIDVEIQGEKQSARMMAQNSSGVDLNYKKTSDVGKTSSDVLDVSMDLDNGDGSRRTKFIVSGEGAGAGSNIFVDKISGAFSGSAKTWIETDEEGGKSFDMTFAFEGKNLSYHGLFYNVGQNGRPAEGERISGVGNWSIWRHYNKTTVPVTAEDWLGFCAGLNRDVILDPTVSNGVYFAPEGWYVDENGILWRIKDPSLGYYMDKDGNMQTIQNSTMEE